MKVARQRTPGLRHIYNKFRKRNPSFQGKIILKLSIARDGKVSEAIFASSTTGDGEFDREIKSSISRWKFKSSSEHTMEILPISFTE